MSYPSILEVKLKSIIFNGSVLVDSVNFEIDEPGIYLLTGENGSGKTTLLRSIVGLIPHVYSKIKIDGNISICGYDSYTAIKKQLVTYVPQVPSSFFLGATVIQELRLTNTPIYKAKDFSRFLNYPLDWLSDGYKYRLLLRTGLTGKQRLMLIDEPSSYIDPWTIKNILKEIEEKAKEYGTSFIIADHKQWIYQDTISRQIILQKSREYTNSSITEKSEINLSVIPHNSQPRIALKNAYFSYNEINVLKNSDFEAREGEKIVILGKNGAGKTTLLKCISGMLGCKGNIDVNGKIFFIPHSRIRYFTKSTVIKEIKTYAHKNLEQDIIDDIITFLGLQDKLKLNPYNLSIGETRRLFFLLGIISGANILVVDEVSLGLDNTYRKKIMEVIDLFAKNGGIVVASTHDMELAKYFDRKLLLEDGELSEI